MEFPTVWQENSPPSLVDITIKVCINHASILMDCGSATVHCKLKDDISLPREICDRMVQIGRTIINDPTSNCIQIRHLLQLFQDPIRTRLGRVNLNNSEISDDILELVTQHNITELNIANCPKLTEKSFSSLNRLKSSLFSLVVGNTTNVFPYINTDLGTDEVSVDFFRDDEDIYEPGCKYILDIPHLRKFVVEGYSFPQSTKYFYHSLLNMKMLNYLDLSSCKNVYRLEFLRNHKHLLSLILYNVQELDACFDSICSITTLRHLDISQPSEHHVFYKNPNRILRTLVLNLTNLASLDISGTNLAGDKVQEREENLLFEEHKNTRSRDEDADEHVTDIAGLKSRVCRPLEFLGLYETAHEACYRHHIPAKRIAGDANEEQILIAGQTYCSRADIIQRILNDLFHIFRFSTCNNTRLALDVIMESMKQHIKEKHIQISGSASLFYIVKGREKNNFNIKIKRNIIKTLLDAMHEHTSDFTMVRNGCLTLIHFKIPDDVLFYYDRLVDILLIVISQDDRDEFVQRIGVYLLNSIACQVDGIHKELVGERGAISVMLTLIGKRLAQNICDEVMETAWSTMWNVTDETPVNCRRFLDGDGMNQFLLCLETFPDKAELLRNMMGLLGNVAEVKELRPFLMTKKFLSVFSDLLDNRQDGIEVSYNAAGIISHIASDGPELWADHNIPLSNRRTILNRMVQAINSWNLDTKRNINYRSFEPILRLLYDAIAPEAQYWAIWALTNLTRVYPDKYCPLLNKEYGLMIIEKHSKYHHYPPVRDLACLILEQCTKFDKEANDDDDEHSYVHRTLQIMSQNPN